MNESRFVQWKNSNPAAYNELLQRRRKKYASDPAAREKQLAYNAAWREKQKRKARRSRAPRSRMIEIDGNQVECWSVSSTANFLGVSKQTITNLEFLGTIPTNHYVCPTSRHRFWPALYVKWLKPFFDTRFPENGPGIPAREFHRRVWTAWGEEQVRGVIPVIATTASNDSEESNDS